MTQRTIILLTIAGILCVSAASFGGSFVATQIVHRQKNQNLDALNNQLAELKTKLDGSEKKRRPGASKLTDIETSTDDLQTSTDDLKNLIEDLNLKIDSIDSNVSSIEMDVSDIKSDVGTIESTVSSIQLKIGY